MSAWREGKHPKAGRTFRTVYEPMNPSELPPGSSLILIAPEQEGAYREVHFYRTGRRILPPLALYGNVHQVYPRLQGESDRWVVNQEVIGAAMHAARSALPGVVVIETIILPNVKPMEVNPDFL